MALLLPDAPPATLPMDRPGIAGVVTSSKLAAETPVKVAPPRSATVSLAPFRFASVSGVGVDARVAPVTAIWNVRVAASLAAVFESSSVAVMVTGCAPLAVVGVPQISRGSVPGHAPVPSASKTRPVGRLDAL